MAMIKFYTKLLIIFNFFFHISLSLWGNPVAGLYEPPVKMINFGTENPFSFVPVGWSDKGICAFMVRDTIQGVVELVIFDGVDDRILFRSESYKLPEGGIPEIWITNQDSISGILGDHSIVPDRAPLYGPADFSWGNDQYALFGDSTMLPGNRGIASLSLMIRSERRGIKKLYTYVHRDSSGKLILDSSVVGYYLSPSERRICAISLDETVSPAGVHHLELRFNGAHLTIGFTRVQTSETGLTEAVLSGQYFTTRSYLDKEADPNIAIEGDPLILIAAKQGNWDIVFLLIERGAESAVIDSRGRILLHYAAREGNREIVIRLLAMGMNKDFLDSDSKSPADLAGEAGMSALVPLLEN